MKVFRPTRQWVEGLRIGDMAPDCFGRLRPVVDIFARGDDIQGRAFVCYYTKFSDCSRISGSAKEGELVMSIPAVSEYRTSWQVPDEAITEDIEEAF